MLHVRGAVLGVVALLGILVGAVLAAVYFGFAPMAADGQATSLESRLAMAAVHALAARQMGDRTSPLATTEANVSAGLEVYRSNCIMCHGAADGKVSNIAAGFYIPSPQFATDGVEDDPLGVTYWKIRHGIRFSAMPAFRYSLTDTQMWQAAMFVKNMKSLPSPVEAAWKASKSVGGAGARPR